MSVEDVITQAKSRVEGLLEPVNGGVGEDVSYDELFDAMKVELDKLTAVDGGKPDWRSVAGNAEELLREKSKDFRVALNYAAAMAVTGGMNGLIDGVVLMQELTTRYWDTMYPALKRPRTRGNAVGWYSDTIGPSVAAIVVTDKERDTCLAIDQLTRALDIEWRDKLGEAYSGMSALREQVRNLVARAPAPPPPPPPPKPEPAPGAAPVSAAGAADGAPVSSAQASAASTTAELPAGPPGPTPDSIEDVDSAFRVTGELAPLFDKAANVLFQADGTNPNGYLFCQLGAWLAVTQDPANNGGNTYYGAPFAHVVSGLTDLHGAADWSALLTAAQEAVMQSPIYLDAHRYMVTALENLGEDYARARNVVVHGLVTLLARAPGLPEMNFTDGTPLANDETKQWIAGLAAGGGGGGGGGGAGSSPIDKAISQAKQTASEGDLQAAMTQLSKAVAQATTPMQKFKGRLELAKLCVEQNLTDIALAQLEGLEKVADNHRLIDWEPALATDLYVNLYSVRRTSTDQNDPEQRAKLALAFERLCQLDAGQALKVFQR